jgi:hypothetical protein
MGLCSDQKYVYKYVKISKWSYAQVKNMFASTSKLMIGAMLGSFFHAGFAGQWVLNKDPIFWLEWS